MKNKTKVSIFLVILLLLIALGAAGFYFVSYDNEKKARNQLEEQLNLITGQRDKIQKQLEELVKEKTSLETKVKEKEVFISNLNDKLTQEIQAKELLLSEQEGLRKKITETEQEKEEIKNTLSKKLEELTQLKIRLDNVISEKDKLNKNIESPSSEKSAEDLDKIIVTPSASSDEIKEEVKEPRLPLSSKVLLINREYDFLVLNIGKPDGVELGDVFEVVHEDKILGRVRIEQVRETMSAANFLEDFKEEQVSEGDVANRID